MSDAHTNRKRQDVYRTQVSSLNLPGGSGCDMKNRVSLYILPSHQMQQGLQSLARLPGSRSQE